MADRLQPRRDTAARWAAVNPVLLEGEWGVVTDNPAYYKIGDGVAAWNDLPLRGYDGTLVQTTGNGTQTVMSQDATTKALAAQKNYTDTKATEAATNLIATEQRIDGELGELRQEVADNYAKQAGEYKELTAGFAYDIVGDGQATEEEFSFRPTAGEDRNVANTTYYDGERNGVARIEKIKGNSVVWNNRALLVTSGDENNGITMTVDSNGLLLNGTATSQSVIRIAQYGNFTYNVGHKYILVVDAIDRSTNNDVRFADYNIANVIGGTSIIYTPSTAALCNIVIFIKSGVTLDNYRILGIICSDLTQMFDAGNEPTTVEEFYQRLPKGVDINAYNEGEIVDANYKAIKTTGLNQWDEQWKGGYYQGSDGQFVSSPNDLANKNPIPIIGGMPYYFNQINSSGGLIRVLFYDHNLHYIAPRLDVAIQGQKVIAPINAAYCNFFISGLTTYNNDICINLSWDTEYGYMNGTYQPYKPFERDLSWVNKYFPAAINGETKYGMRSAGSSARDEIRFNSSTQKWEAVQNVGVRAYTSGDESDTAVTTDGTNTNYALGTPVVTEITEDVNLDFDASDYGTEELIVAEGAQSAPIVADIVYEPNALNAIKQVPDILKRLKALETAMATTTASTNVTEEE